MPPRDSSRSIFRFSALVALAVAVPYGAFGCQRPQQPTAPQPYPYGYPTQGYPTGYPQQPPYPPQPYPQPYPTYAPTYQPAPSYGPQPGYPPAPASTPTAPAPSTPPPATPAPTGPRPAAGLPCTSDTDFTCTFSRCIQGSCGGCTSNADCKANAKCAATPFGQACIFSPTPTGPGPAPASSDPYAAARQQCVDKTNAYRARISAQPLARVSERESCIDKQAASDAQSGKAHGSFGQCQEASQNECPGYPGTVESVVNTCLEQMWNEGPGEPYSAHGHYLNMAGPYKSIACGVHVTADGKVWLIQDFYR